jgi:helix-turn-helix protein
MTSPTPHTLTDYRFAPIPEELLFCPDLTPLAVRIYGVLMRKGTDPSSCFPSHAEIGRKACCSQRSVAVPVKSLEELGWITRVPRFSEAGDPLSNGYHVHTSPTTNVSFQRGVPAEERGGVPAEERGGPRSGTRLKRATQREQLDKRPSANDNAFECRFDAPPSDDDQPPDNLENVRRIRKTVNPTADAEVAS